MKKITIKAKVIGDCEAGIKVNIKCPYSDFVGMSGAIVSQFIKTADGRGESEGRAYRRMLSKLINGETNVEAG